jgi:hypothetical protein
VAGYRRPPFGFNKILFAEKEGFFPILRHAHWPEIWDCALCSSKGFATRAARALIRLLKESGEPITVFVIHDADGPGTVIYEALSTALEPFGIEVINLGLDPAEARAMGLPVEPVQKKGRNKGAKRVPVAEYLPGSDREWLQTHRVELNAMATPQLVGWLTAKVAAHDRGKVVPPPDVVRSRLEEEVRADLERRIIHEVLSAADIPGRVTAAYAAAKDVVTAAADSLPDALPGHLTENPRRHWTGVVKAAAERIGRGSDHAK